VAVAVVLVEQQTLLVVLVALAQFFFTIKKDKQWQHTQ
jgi:hypothetical protein